MSLQSSATRTRFLLNVCIWWGTQQRGWHTNIKKSWTKRGVNKLLKKLQDTGTVDRRPGSGRPHSARTEENFETVNDLVLSQEEKRLEIQTFYQNLVFTAEYHVGCWQTLQLEAIKNAICLHFLPYMLNVCRKFEFSISQSSAATCLRWGGVERWELFWDTV